MSENQHSNSTAKFIVPPTTLRERVKITGSGPIDMAPIQRAERALEQLSVAFDGWLNEEVAALTEARAQVRAKGLTEDTRKELHRTAHDLKGQGETYGYPLITIVCATLCKLLESATELDLIPLDIIDHHVDAVRNMMKMKIKSDDHPQSLAVSNKLYDVVMEFVEHEEEKRKKPSLGQGEAAEQDRAENHSGAAA